MKVIAITVAVVGALVVLVQPVVAQDFQKGIEAHDRDDYATALREFKALAEQGDVNAQFLLGEMYANGQGLTQDYAQAVKWYRLAAEQGDAFAQNNLGLMYAEGRGVTQDYARAVKWYRLAAEQGFAVAQYNLGFRYHNGEGVTQDYARAVKWFRLAADQGVAGAQNNLGVMHAKGRGVTQDYAEAVKWYRLATEQGNADAQRNLGVMYATGLGVTQDDVQAHMWFNLSAAQGGKNSTAVRDLVEKSMTTADISKAQRMARQWRPGQQSAVPRSSGPTATGKRIANVQRGLAALGYDPGPVDGILGAKTRAAIRAFQAREKRPVTGVVSEELAAALQSVSGAGQARKAVE